MIESTDIFSAKDDESSTVKVFTFDDNICIGTSMWGNDDNCVSLTKEQAVEMARSILSYFNETHSEYQVKAGEQLMGQLDVTSMGYISKGPDNG